MQNKKTKLQTMEKGLENSFLELENSWIIIGGWLYKISQLIDSENDQSNEWKSLTGFTWNNKGTIAAGSIALSYQEEIEIATEFLKGMGEKIEPVIKIAKQYGLPILAVITILYGGKKIHDMITNDDMDDAVAEDNVLEQALVELKKLAGI